MSRRHLNVGCLLAILDPHRHRGSVDLLHGAESEAVEFARRGAGRERGRRELIDIAAALAERIVCRAGATSGARRPLRTIDAN